jgi:acyl-CoA reductase-like NAD-dependent aldehyde dehydrogenase
MSPRVTGAILASTMKTAQQYIAGNWLASVNAQSRNGDSMNPATGLAAARFFEANVADAQACVAAAREAFETSAWAHQPRLRADVLRLFADRLEARQNEVADVLVMLNGKLKREALGEIGASIAELRYYAGLARAIFGRTIEVEPGCYSLLDREAIGVAAIIVPWNAPVTLLIRSLAPALAAGCSVVIKAAHQTALVNQLVLECLTADARVPVGIVNSFTESGSEATQDLCANPQVDVISFTGSTTVGKAIARASAANLTRLSLELGGKSPAIVMADANLDLAIPAIVSHSTVMAGQMCTAIARVLVQAPLRDEVSRRIAEAYRNLKVGPGDSPQSQMGPLIDLPNRNRIRQLAEQVEGVGQVIQMGQIPKDLPAGGAFITPSLVALQDLSSTYIQNELFGPLLVLESFEDDAQCLVRANATRFGLAASVWSADAQRARRMARELKSGTVWLNAHNKLYAEAETGGYRESGYGRLHGVEGLNDFLETKHVYLETGTV